jgi:hypothetical protein
LTETNEDANGIPLSKENEALLEYAKNAIIESLNVVKDFIRMMIPLTTGLITIYFALLQILGIDNTVGSTDKHFLIVPPVILLASLVSFLVASFPIPKKLAISNLNSIIAYRTAALRWKYIGTIIGSGLFIIGVLMIILNAQSLL